MKKSSKRNWGDFLSAPDEDIKNITLADFKNKSVSDIVWGNTKYVIRSICVRIVIVLTTIFFLIFLIGATNQPAPVENYNDDASCVITIDRSKTDANKLINAVNKHKGRNEKDYIGSYVLTKNIRPVDRPRQIHR